MRLQLNPFFHLLFTALIISLVSCSSNKPAETGDKSIYDEFYSLAQVGPQIPYLEEGAIPQGISYNNNQNTLLISNDMLGKDTSTITIVSLNTDSSKSSTNISEPLIEVREIWEADKEFRQRLEWVKESERSERLERIDGISSLVGLERIKNSKQLKGLGHLEGLDHFKGHRGHVGGITLSKDYIWISSGKKIYYSPRSNLENRESMVYMVGIEIPMKGSFTSYSDNTLWIGEYAKAWGRYSVRLSHNRRSTTGEVHHAWLAGYILGDNENPKETDFETPDYILSIPDRMQGIIVTKDHIITSQSGGFENPSLLKIYKNPLNYQPDEAKKKKPPLWLLDERYLLKTLNCLPMMEEICLVDNKIYLLYESASRFFYGLPDIITDRIHILNLSDMGLSEIQ